MEHRHLLHIVLLWYCATKSNGASINLTVNASVALGEVKHFWKSTGFCPPSPHDEAYLFDLGSDMRLNLALVGSVAHSGMQQVRIHWLYDLVIAKSSGPFEVPTFHFVYLDQVIDLLIDDGLRPGFELMGNPSSIFTTMEEKQQVINWKELVYQTAQRYIDIYGLGEVMQWNFETWNEPDCRGFDKLNMTVQGFLNYYDACSEGLKKASPLLRLGGPADGCLRTDYGYALLDHVVNGYNYFTGEKGVRIDYLSYHLKGGGSSQTILENEIELMKGIAGQYPSLANKPFYNDEADPLVGWSKDEEWRADATYAAMVAKIITQHHYNFISDPMPSIKNYTLLSNDNGFLSWYPHQFTQRTLLARLQINTTSPPHTQFFQKPVYSVMGLLAHLGEKQLEVTLTDVGPSGNPTPLPLDGELGVIASVHEPLIRQSADSWQMSILMYYNNDTGPQTGHHEIHTDIYLQPPAYASDDLVLTLWIVDNTYGNPYGIWTKLGQPAFPTLDQIHEMRVMEGAELLYRDVVHPGQIELGELGLYEPAVALVHVCSRPAYVPDQVNNVHFYNITGGQVLITWSDKCVNSRCILTYDVEYSKDNDPQTYSKINPKDALKFTTAFTYSPLPTDGADPEDMVRGFYKVRAVDYFGQFGYFSLPEEYRPK